MIGEALKQLRNLKKLTQEALAERLSTSSGHISEIETGKKIPGGDFLLTLKREFRLSIDSLFNGEVLFDKDEVQDHPASGADSDLIGMTREILASGTIYARSLEVNIQAFREAIATETSLRTEIRNLRDEVKEIQGSIVDIRAVKEIINQVDQVVERNTMDGQPERRKINIELREVLGKSPFSRAPKPPDPNKISGAPGSGDPDRR